MKSIYYIIAFSLGLASISVFPQAPLINPDVKEQIQEKLSGVNAGSGEFQKPAQRQQEPATNNITSSSKNTFADIRKTLGFVPEFMQEMPEEAISGAWQEFKNLNLSATDIPLKEKQLISLASSISANCQKCVQLHAALAKAYGATEAEIKEVIGLASISGHWRAAFSGLDLKQNSFRKDIQKMAEKLKKIKNRKNKLGE